MTTAQSYKRFGDENYKNWLKTAESLSILRLRMEDFIDKETETYHASLRNNPALEGKICTNKCDTKKNKKVNNSIYSIIEYCNYYYSHAHL